MSAAVGIPTKLNNERARTDLSAPPSRTLPPDPPPSPAQHDPRAPAATAVAPAVLPRAPASASGRADAPPPAVHQLQAQLRLLPAALAFVTFLGHHPPEPVLG